MYFLPRNTTKLSENFLDVLKDFVHPFLDLHQPDSALMRVMPWSKTIKDFLQGNKIPVLERPRDSADLHLTDCVGTHQGADGYHSDPINSTPAGGRRTGLESTRMSQRL